MDTPDPYLSLVDQFPHCDAYVLHPPGTCEYCDSPSCAPLHEYRRVHGVNHTGVWDLSKAPCPAEVRRPKAKIDRWPGNQAKPK